jgi:hypothetical protein
MKVLLVLIVATAMVVCLAAVPQQKPERMMGDELYAAYLASGPEVDVSSRVCFYVFMRTTVMLAPDLFRLAKARSAERGESLKALFTRALAAELAAPVAAAAPAARVRLPLFGDPAGPKIRLTNRDLATRLAEADVAEFVARDGRRRPRRVRARG